MHARTSAVLATSAALLLAACGGATYSSKEMRASFDHCEMRVSFEGGDNGDIVDCMKLDLPKLSYEDAKSYVKKIKVDDAWLNK